MHLNITPAFARLHGLTGFRKRNMVYGVVMVVFGTPHNNT